MVTVGAASLGTSMSTALSLMIGAASSETTPQMVVDEFEAVDEMVTDTDA